jgi:hypothetical protein
MKIKWVTRCCVMTPCGTVTDITTNASIIVLLTFVMNVMVILVDLIVAAISSQKASEVFKEGKTRGRVCAGGV